MLERAYISPAFRLFPLVEGAAFHDRPHPAEGVSLRFKAICWGCYDGRCPGLGTCLVSVCNWRC
jgi:hypothetical protein